MITGGTIHCCPVVYSRVSLVEVEVVVEDIITDVILTTIAMSRMKNPLPCRHDLLLDHTK